MAELEATMDTEEEAGWVEFYRMEAEEVEAEKKKREAELKSKTKGR